jgi:hypothetical protein
MLEEQGRLATPRPFCHLLPGWRKGVLLFIAGFGLLGSSALPAQTPGSLDLDFTPDTAASDVFWGLAIQPDGKIVVAGKFTTFSGQSRYGVARLQGDPAVIPPALEVQHSSTNVVLNWTGQFTLQSSTHAAGPYFDVAAATNPPCTLPVRFSSEFFRLRN